MKLKNKKTGEIMEFDAILPVKDVAGDSVAHLEYNSLAEFNNEWEDYEEPKVYWYLENNGEIVKTTYEGDLYEEKMQEVGNYFETKKEAEKAVEKLKAWKRLKDYNVMFKLDFVKNTISFTYRIDDTLHSVVNEERIVFDDMKTIFGGEE